MNQAPATILFDGECNLCNGFVQFVIRHDKAGRFRFAALQSEAGQALILPFFQGREVPDSVVLVQDGKCYTRSAAALRVLRQLSGAWPLLYGFTIVPALIRDPVYDWVARNRYRWFGKRDSCMIPTPELRSRFL